MLRACGSGTAYGLSICGVFKVGGGGGGAGLRFKSLSLEPAKR